MLTLKNTSYEHLFIVLRQKITATQSNSGATVRKLSPICMKWFQIFTKIEIKIPQSSKYFDKNYFNVIVNNLQWIKIIH